MRPLRSMTEPPTQRATNQGRQHGSRHREYHIPTNAHTTIVHPLRNGGGSNGTAACGSRGGDRPAGPWRNTRSSGAHATGGDGAGTGVRCGAWVVARCRSTRWVMSTVVGYARSSFFRPRVDHRHDQHRFAAGVRSPFESRYMVA